MLEKKVVLITSYHQLQSIWELGIEGGTAAGGGGVVEVYLGVSDSRSVNASSRMANSCTILSVEARRGGPACGRSTLLSESESSSKSEPSKVKVSVSAMSAMPSGVERETAALRSCSRSRNLMVGRFLGVLPFSSV